MNREIRKKLPRINKTKTKILASIFPMLLLVNLVPFASAQATVTYNGFANYSYPLTTGAVDDLIELMEQHNLNVYRMSIRPSWSEGSHPYKPELIQHYLDNTPDNWIIIIDANHLIDWGTEEATTHWNEMKLRLKQVCTDFPDTSRVWVELWNELSIGYNEFYERAQELINYVRNEGFTHTLVVNKLDTSGYNWKQLNDPLDKTYQGYHGYFQNPRDIEYLFDSMQTAVNMGIKIINTEIGANCWNPEEWTQNQVNYLQEFTQNCAQIGVGNCIWTSWGTDWYYELTDRGYEFDNPAITELRTEPTQETEPRLFRLTTSVNKNEGGTITPIGKTYYPEGTVVTIQANPNNSWYRDWWDVDGSRAYTDTNTLQITMDSDHNVYVDFDETTTTYSRWSRWR